MDTNKATYWIALAVLVLGLNSEYRQGKFVTLHRVADRAGFVLCGATTHAQRTLTAALGLVGREARPSDDLLASVSRADSYREQAESLREQERNEAERVRDIQEQVRDQVRDQFVAQRDAIRAQADLQRAEIVRIRDTARAQFRVVRSAEGRITMICPKTKTRIVVNDASDLADNLPEVE
jgi:hypothetical protein